jgi:hypothetical protein
MSKKSIAQTMQDAGFKPLSRAQQQQNIKTLTPVWIEEQNDMTTKTDEARDCAKEIPQWLLDACDEIRKDNIRWREHMLTQDMAKMILKHFPPSVPVKMKIIYRNRGGLFSWQRYDKNQAIKQLQCGDIVELYSCHRLESLEAELIAEAK